MKETTEMLTDSGCAKQPTAAIIVLNGKIVGRGTNAGKRGGFCPRMERKYKTGEGYHLCKEICEQEGHAEVMAIKSAKINLKGADLYLNGHWWICKDCWAAIIKAGIKNVYLRGDSVELYKK